jgi:predicted kinase
MNEKGTLIFFCGKMGSGKSTLSREIASQIEAILLSEDEWLKTIYPDEIENFEDYIKYSSRLKPLVKHHVQNILNSGISVVMDFPGNTEKQRAWFKEIYAEHNFSHKLIYLEASDNLCLKQLETRRKTHPERAQFDTEDVFHQVTSYFQSPSEHECFNVEVVYRENA